jgi:hypothetical protein
MLQGIQSSAARILSPPPPENFCYALEFLDELSYLRPAHTSKPDMSPRPQDSVVLNRWELFLSPAELEAGFYIRNWEPADVYFPPGAILPRESQKCSQKRKSHDDAGHHGQL